MAGDFRVNLYRGSKNGDKINGTNDTNDTIGTNNMVKAEENQIIELLKENPKLTQKEIHETLNISLRSVKRIMTDMQKKGLIGRKGNNRSGEWLILKKITK